MKKILPFINTGLSLFLTLGTKFIFHACGPKDDGSYMMCHYAQTTVTALGIVITVTALLSAVIKDEKIKAGLSMSLIPPAVLAIFIPNIIIPLCMMSSMRCQSIMRPCIILVSIVIIVIAALTAFFNLKKSN